MKKRTIRFVDQIDDTSTSTEDQLGPENDDIHHSIKKKTIIQAMMGTMSFQTNATGSIPVLTCSEMCVDSPVSPQMAINSTQPLTTNRQHSQTLSEME